MIILKTRVENLGGVVKAQKHALWGRLRNVLTDDLLLLAEIRAHGSALVRYGMRFRRQRRADPGETEAIWGGQRWPYIIDGEDCCELNTAFDPQKEKVTTANYGQGGTVFYVVAEDADAFRSKGLLAPLL